ncbi:hypothetical protein U1Q18_006883, partial [Sarracenia purpurea var. burkii]
MGVLVSVVCLFFAVNDALPLLLLPDGCWWGLMLSSFVQLGSGWLLDFEVNRSSNLATWFSRFCFAQLVLILLLNSVSLLSSPLLDDKGLDLAHRCRSSPPKPLSATIISSKILNFASTFKTLTSAFRISSASFVQWERWFETVDSGTRDCMT